MTVALVPSTIRPVGAAYGSRPAASAQPRAAERAADTLALSAFPLGAGVFTFDDYEANPELEVMPGLNADPVGGSAPRPVLRPGSRGPAVQALQKALQAAGFDPGAADGDFGARTERAVRRFQAARGLGVDGLAGAATQRALGLVSEPAAPGLSARMADGLSSLGSRLRNNLRGAYWKGRHKCFRYAWSLVARTGGKGIGTASQSREGRGRGVAALDEMVRNGQVREGDVIYVNRVPGADPSSRNLKYGPHWFVYIGQGIFADQYGERSAAAMANFVPGRKIDTIYRSFS